MPIHEVTQPDRTDNFVATHPHLPFHLPISHPYPADSSLNKPLTTYLQPVPNFTPPIVSLRGGAGSPADQVRLPPTLFWLTGGREKPVTVKAWKEAKPKKRMGGLLGLAVNGVGAGTWCNGKEGVKSFEEGKEKEKEEGELAGPKTNNGNAASVKSSKSYLSKSSVKAHSSRSLKSSSSPRLSRSKGESNTAVANGEGAQKAVPLETVAEEATVPKGDAAPRDEQAASDASRDALAEGAAENAPAENAGDNASGNAEPVAGSEGNGNTAGAQNAAEAEDAKS